MLRYVVRIWWPCMQNAFFFCWTILIFAHPAFFCHHIWFASNKNNKTKKIQQTTSNILQSADPRRFLISKDNSFHTYPFGAHCTHILYRKASVFFLKREIQNGTFIFFQNDFCVSLWLKLSGGFAYFCFFLSWSFVCWIKIQYFAVVVVLRIAIRNEYDSQ